MITDPIPEIIHTHSTLDDKINALSAIAESLPIVIIVHDLQSQGVIYMSPNGLKILGCTLEEIKELGPAYHDMFFNKEDLADYAPKVFSLLNSSDDDIIVSNFQQVRPSHDHDWKWYLTTHKVFMRDETGTPTHLIAAASPIDPLHHVTSKVNRLLEENNFLRRNQKVFTSLGKREKEILKFMALGKSTAEMAANLFISEQTVNTHRRNIKAKLNAESNYDIVKFAQSFDLI